MDLLNKLIRRVFILYSEIYGFLARKLYKTYPLYPSKVTFKITNICNVDCHFCYNAEKNTQEERKKEIDIEQWKLVVDSTPKTTAISFTGGEAFLYPKIYELLDYIKLKKRKASVVSNGLAFNEKQIEKIVDSKLYYLMVSIHGREDIHNEILKGNQNHYQKLIKNLQTLKKIKKEKNSNYPIIGVKVVITNENIEDIPHILDLAENKIGASHVYFNLLSNEKFELFDDVNESFENKESIFQYEKENIPKIHSIIDFIFKYKKSSKMDIGFTNAFKNKAQLKNYIANPFKFQPSSCNKPWHEIYIQPNGDICLCIKYIITNIKDINYSLKNLIHHPKYRTVLKNFQQKNRKTKYCNTCLEAKFEPNTNPVSA